MIFKTLSKCLVVLATISMATPFKDKDQLINPDTRNILINTIPKKGFDKDIAETMKLVANELSAITEQVPVKQRFMYTSEPI